MIAKSCPHPKLPLRNIWMYNTSLVYVVTYDCPHRKTYDVLTLLETKGYRNVTVFYHPMTYKKMFRPLLQHRPSDLHAIDTQTLCQNLDFRCVSLPSLEYLSDYVSEIGETPVLIAGAGLIPNDLLHKITFINAHPGYSPYARGLDAFKWSILKNLPIGVTVHTVGWDSEEKRREETLPIQGYTSHAYTCNQLKRIRSTPWHTKSTNMKFHCSFNRSKCTKMPSKKIVLSNRYRTSRQRVACPMIWNAPWI